jgi:hypothetical protein
VEKIDVSEFVEFYDKVSLSAEAGKAFLRYKPPYRDSLWKVKKSFRMDVGGVVYAVTEMNKAMNPSGGSVAKADQRLEVTTATLKANLNSSILNTPIDESQVRSTDRSGCSQKGDRELMPRTLCSADRCMISSRRWTPRGTTARWSCGTFSS